MNDEPIIPIKMTPDEYVDYCRKVAITRPDFPDWRIGQTYFNVLRMLQPEIAEQFRGESIDPFYSDDRIPNFLSVLVKYHVAWEA